MMIFLSGACKNVSVEARNSWREWFEKQARIDNAVKVFNPNAKFSYEANDPRNSQLVMDYFLNRLDKSDVVVVNLEDSALSCGTAMEVMHAKDTGKFILGISGDNYYDYIRDCCNVIVPDKESAWQFLMDYFLSC